MSIDLINFRISDESTANPSGSDEYRHDPDSDLPCVYAEARSALSVQR